MAQPLHFHFYSAGPDYVYIHSHFTIYLTLKLFTISVLKYLEEKKEVEMLMFVYLVGPYYAGPKSTPAPFTPALIPPRANFDLPPFRAAFNATIGKNQKNQKKGKVLKLQEQLFRFQCVFFSRRIKFSMIKYLL